MDQEKTKAEVWKTIQDMNLLWTVENKADDLVKYFHKDMVAITPANKMRVEGQAACVAGWKGFAESARIFSWKEIDPKIELFGDGNFAVVTYYFDMSFEMGGQKIKMGGRDMFSLIKENGKWLIVSDQFSAYP